MLRFQISKGLSTWQPNDSCSLLACTTIPWTSSLWRRGDSWVAGRLESVSSFISERLLHLWQNKLSQLVNNTVYCIRRGRTKLGTGYADFNWGWSVKYDASRVMTPSLPMDQPDLGSLMKLLVDWSSSEKRSIISKQLITRLPWSTSPTMPRKLQQTWPMSLTHGPGGWARTKGEKT